MTREEASNVLWWASKQYYPGDQMDITEYHIEAFDMAITALREKAERERGCAYCVIGKRSPDAEYCSNCGRKLTPTLPELANESEEVNQDSETAETCTLRCEYCGKYTQDSDLSTEWVGDKYLMCSKCKEKHT